MAKKRKFRETKTITYNIYAPNRAARRRGIKPEEPPKEEKPKRRIASMQERIERTKAKQERITPPGMTYGQYMKYLEEKRQQLRRKKENG